MAVEEGQMRAIVNTLLSIASSCIATFVVSAIVGKGRLNMVTLKTGIFLFSYRIKKIGN